MIPFLFRTEYVMKLWLGDVPSHTVVFAQCAVFLSLTYAAFEPIRTAVYATNRIKKFMLIPDTLYLLVLPIGYLIGKLTDNPSFFIASTVAFEVIVCIVRVIYASQVTLFCKRELMIKILFPCLLVAVVDCLICYGLSHLFSSTLLGLIAIVLLNALCLMLIIPLLGLSTNERNQVKLLLIRRVNIKNEYFTSTHQSAQHSST